MPSNYLIYLHIVDNLLINKSVYRDHCDPSLDEPDIQLLGGCENMF